MDYDDYAADRNAKKFTAKRFDSANRNAKQLLRSYRNTSVNDVAGEELHLENNSPLFVNA